MNCYTRAAQNVQLPDHFVPCSDSFWIWCSCIMVHFMLVTTSTCKINSFSDLNFLSDLSGFSVVQHNVCEQSIGFGFVCVCWQSWMLTAVTTVNVGIHVRNILSRWLPLHDMWVRQHRLSYVNILWAKFFVSRSKVRKINLCAMWLKADGKSRRTGKRTVTGDGTFSTGKTQKSDMKSPK